MNTVGNGEKQERRSSKGDVEISIVIVNWNAKAWLRQCLESIVSQPDSEKYEIIVVDNASTDGSVAMIGQEFPAVHVVESRKNIGFAGGNNLGITTSHGEYLCLINPDVVVLNGCIQELLAFMETHPKVGLAGPELMNADLTVQESWSSYPSIWSILCYVLGLARCWGNRCHPPSSRMREGGEWYEVEVLYGAFWFARRRAIDDVGPIDERFFMYVEDVDWCRRFAQKDWQVSYVPAAEAIHFGGKSSDQQAKRTFLQFQRSRMLYFIKYHGRVYYVCVAALLLLGHFVRLPYWSLVFFLQPSRRIRARERLGNLYASILWHMKYLMLGGWLGHNFHNSR